MAVKEPAASSGFPMPLAPVAMMEGGARWLETITRNMTSMLQAAQGAANHLMACQEAALNLGLERMRKNQEAARACLGLETPADLVHLGAKYQRTMVEDYVAFGHRIGDMTLAATRDHIAPLEKRAEEALSGMIKAA